MPRPEELFCPLCNTQVTVNRQRLNRPKHPNHVTTCPDCDTNYLSWRDGICKVCKYDGNQLCDVQGSPFTLQMFPWDFSRPVNSDDRSLRRIREDPNFIGTDYKCREAKGSLLFLENRRVDVSPKRLEPIGYVCGRWDETGKPARREWVLGLLMKAVE